MTQKNGKAAYEHYRRQIESLDRQQLVELAVAGWFYMLGESGMGADTQANDYYLGTPGAPPQLEPYRVEP